MAALPVAALVMIAMPQTVTDSLRVWAGPVFSPLQDLTQGWALDLADRIRNPGGAKSPDDGPSVQEQLATCQNALAQAAAMLNDYDRRVRDLAQIRQGLDGLPCRLIPARLVPPEMSVGPTSARLGEGADRGIRKGGGVINRRLDRGAREAVQRGEPILTAAGLVGIVDEVGPFTSTVRLVTDPGTVVMVQVVTFRNNTWRAGPEGLARGSSDGTAIVVTGIPKDADVAPGDFLVTSPSPKSALPPYLVVGRVTECVAKPAAVFRTLVAQPRVVPAEARDVYVMAPDYGDTTRK
jgi:hypothetical protein